MRWLLLVSLLLVAICSFADDQLVQEALKRNALLQASKLDVTRFNNYSSRTQLKLNLKTSNTVFAAYTSIDRVPTTRTVNGQALSANISLTSSDVGATTLEQVQDNLGGTTGGDGFLKSADGHLTITYSDSTPSLVLGVIGSICNYPTGIEFGSTTQQYDVTGTTFVSASAGGSLGGVPASSSGNTLADAVDAITTARDNKYLVVQEKTGVASSTNPLTVQFLFTGITSFNTINTRSFYNGSISHNTSIQLWNYTTSAWDTYATFAGETDYVSRSLEVFNHAPYVSGGNAKLQFIHLSAGSATHDIKFDYVALCDGGGGGGSASIASAVAYVPTGNVAATNVQTAINEIDTEKMKTDYSNAVMGAANTKIFTNATGTAVEWATGMKTGYISRNTATASGTQAVTGVGFKPSMVSFFAVIDATNSTSYGIDDGGGTNANCIYSIITAQSINGGQSISLYVSAGVEYTGKIQSMDADGFTITWTRTGAPTGTAYIIYQAIR